MAFGGFLQANTAVDLIVGPFIDDTDGKTAETALTITQSDVRLSKNGANIAQKNEATSLTHDEIGNYVCKLDATDTNTEGLLSLMIHETGALPVKMDYQVVAQAAYTSLITAKDTGYMDVNVKAVSEDTAAADNLESACDNYSVTRGLAGTALPAAAADAAGGLPISDAGGLDLDTQIGTDIDAILVDTGTTLDNHLTDIKGTGFVKDTHSLIDIEAYVDLIDDGASGLAKIATDVAATLVDTNELQTDLTNGGRLDLILDELTTQGDTNESKIDTIDTNVDAVLVDTGTTLDNHLTDIKGTGFVKDTHSLVDIEAYVDLIDDGASGLAKIASDAAAILVDTAEIGAAGAGLTNINLPNQTMDIIGNITGNLSGSVGSVTGAVGSVTGAVGSVTGNVGGNVGGNVVGSTASVTGNVGGNVTGSVGSVAAGGVTAASFAAGAIDAAAIATDAVDADALAADALAEINAEVVDTLNTDTYAEPGQGAPAATASLVAKIGYMYKFMRNKITNDGSTIKVYNDAGAVVDQKSAVSEAAGTVTRDEFATGP
jgi:hypothetical protein